MPAPSVGRTSAVAVDKFRFEEIERWLPRFEGVGSKTLEIFMREAASILLVARCGKWPMTVCCHQLRQGGPLGAAKSTELLPSTGYGDVDYQTACLNDVNE